MQARALARLSPEAFASVKAGVVDPRQGALIAGYQRATPDLHQMLVAELAAARPRNLDEARFVIEDVLDSRIDEDVTIDLFGPQTELRSLRAERAGLVGEVLNLLRSRKRGFKAAVEASEALTDAGNRLVDDVNVAAGETLSDQEKLFLALAARRGNAVADLVDRAATPGLTGRARQKAARELLGAYTQLYSERGVAGLLRETAPPVPATGFDAPAGPAARLQGEDLLAAVQAARDLSDGVERSAALMAVRNAFGDPVATAVRDRFGGGDAKAIRSSARQWYTDNLAGREVKAEALEGQTVRFPSPRKILTTIASARLDVLPTLPDILAKGKLLVTEADVKKRQNMEAVFKIGANVRVGDEVRPVVVTVRKNQDGQLYYTHFTLRDDARPAQPPGDPVPHKEAGGSRPGGGPHSGNTPPDFEPQDQFALDLAAPEEATTPTAQLRTLDEALEEAQRSDALVERFRGCVLPGFKE
jgi:hypothetical protein